MKMQTAFDYVSSSAHPSQSFCKTVKCAILLLVCAFIVLQDAAQTRSIIGSVAEVKKSAWKDWPGVGFGQQLQGKIAGV